MDTVRQASPNVLKKGQITPYPMPGQEALALNKVDWPLDANDAVLLVHDMQQYYVEFYAGETPLVATIAQLIAGARACGMPIVYTRGERPRHPAERALALQMWGLGMANPAITERDFAIAPPLIPQQQDFIIDKLRVSAFFETPLADLLQKFGRKQIFLCGVFAHHGVMMTSVDAFMRNYKVQLIADALGDYSADDHWMTLRYVAQLSGRVALAQQALDAMAKACV